MLYRLSRKQLVAVLTVSLVLAPIGVALARLAGSSLLVPAKQKATADASVAGNGPAIPGTGLPQYGNRRGFDIPLPASSGPQVALPDEVTPTSFNSLAALDGVGATGGSRNWGAAWGGFRFSPNGGRPGPSRGSASFATSGSGMAGASAWGGVSGTAPARRQAVAQAVRARIQERIAALPPRPSPSRPGGGSSGSGGSGGGSGSGSGDGGSQDGIGGDAAGTPPGFAGAPGAAAGGGAGGAGAAGSLSPAATPEPMSLLLVGAGFAGLYRARKYLA
jgi:hypothetical protein